jgi:SET domain-containing protein
LLQKIAKKKKKKKKACKLKNKTKTLTNQKTKDINTNNFVKTIFCGKEKIRKQIYL